VKKSDGVLVRWLGWSALVFGFCFAIFLSLQTLVSSGIQHAPSFCYRDFVEYCIANTRWYRLLDLPSLIQCSLPGPGIRAFGVSNNSRAN
jgi:hypothetical protein